MKTSDFSGLRNINGSGIIGEKAKRGHFLLSGLRADTNPTQGTFKTPNCSY